MQSVEDKVISRIYGRGRGSVWTPADFGDFGGRDAVDAALSRHARQERIRRIARGLYHYPEKHPILGEVAPSIDNIAKALAGRDHSRLLPSGAYAANLLRLSDQIPARVVFLTDAWSRKVNVGALTIELRRVGPKRVAAAGRTSGLVIEALRYLGKDHVSRKRLEPLLELLSENDQRQLAEDIRLAPEWMQGYLKYIAGEKEEG